MTQCVDASLVIRLLVHQKSLSVRQLWEQWDQDGEKIVAPALIFYEVTNGLYRYQRQGWLSSAVIEAALKAALALPIMIIDDRELHLRAREYAMQFDLPAAYDAHYLALAEKLDCPFWTVDQRLEATLREHAEPRVRIPQL